MVSTPTPHDAVDLVAELDDRIVDVDKAARGGVRSDEPVDPHEDQSGVVPGVPEPPD